VRVGSTVSLKTKDNKRRKYQLVGAAETNPAEGRISDESPLGQALLGKKRGETVKIQAPGGVVEMTITSIS
jgi:transcription elongation factor GreA